MAKTKKADVLTNPSEVLSESDDLKKYIRLGAVGVLLAVAISVGVGVFQQQSKEGVTEQSNLIFDYNNDVITQFSEDKIKEEEFISKTLTFIKKLKNTASFFPTASVFFTKAREKKVASEKIAPVFEALRKGTSKNIAHYYFSTYYSVLLEESKKYGEALGVLKTLVDSPYKFEEKLYLDLGRLSYLSGDKAGALTNFKHVVEKFPNNELAKMAERYIVNYGLETKKEEPVQEKK